MQLLLKTQKKKDDYSALLNAKIFAVDTETTGLNGHGTPAELGFYPARPFAFSFTTYESERFYFRFSVNPYTRRVEYEKNLHEYYIIKRVLENPDSIKIFHNANFDIIMCMFIGIHVKGKIFDTMILCHVSNNSYKKYGLKDLCVNLFPGMFPIDDQEDLIKSVNKARLSGKKAGYRIACKNYFGQEPNKADYWLGDPELCKIYALRDTDRTIALYMCYEDDYANDEVYRTLVDMEHELQIVTREIGLHGMAIDPDSVEELTAYYQDVITRETQIKAKLGYADLNPDSLKQMQAVFYGTDKSKGQLGLPVVYKSRKGKGTETPTLDGDVLESFKDEVPLARCLIELNAAQQQLDSFITPFRQKAFWENGIRVLHTNVRNIGPATGRLSGSDPNLMNISKSTSMKRKSEVDYRCREPFIARPGKLLYAFDFSQIEIWTVAFSTMETVMIDILMSGGKIHDASTLKFYGDRPDFDKELFPDRYDYYRNNAKTANFSIIYGIGARKLSGYLKIPYDEARGIIEAFFELYPNIREFISKNIDEINEHGYTTDVFGRKYFFEPEFAYKSLNFNAGQGPAAQVFKRAMINVFNLFRTRWIGCDILQPVHDELIMEVPEQYHSKKLIREIIAAMQGDSHKYFKMPVPFKVEPSLCRPNWAVKEKLEV